MMRFTGPASSVVFARRWGNTALGVVALFSFGLIGCERSPSDIAESGFGIPDIDPYLTGEYRCAPLRRELERCTGIGVLPTACDNLTDADVSAMTQSLRGAECQALAERAPLDGDPKAASCVLFDDGCIDAINPAPEASAARYPLVFVNGIDVSPLFSWSDRIIGVVNDAGHVAVRAVLPPYEAPKKRALILWDKIETILDDTGADRVNLVCHSLGGLDCRYLASPAGAHWDIENVDHDDITDAIASVTTVGTAHWGTPVADVALGFLPDEDPERGIDALATFLGDWLTGESVEQNVSLRAALTALSESAAPAFNADIIDAEGVVYQSWGGFSRPAGEPADDLDGYHQACAPDDTDGEPSIIGMTLFGGQHDYLSLTLADSYAMVSDADDATAHVPSDGLCPVASARWGRFRGCLPADHQEQLGRTNLPDANVRTGVDIAAFYVAVAGDLASQGL